jgi:hypothetical protein
MLRHFNPLKTSDLMVSVFSFSFFLASAEVIPKAIKMASKKAFLINRIFILGLFVKKKIMNFSKIQSYSIHLAAREK